MKAITIILFILFPAVALAENSNPILKDSTSPSGSSINQKLHAPSTEHQTLYSFFSLYQPYMPQISAYEPIYFLVGTDPEKSKFQYSFKYRFLNSDGSLAKNYPWTGGLHFGYTQTSFWNLKEESLPFKDTSYKPEFFHTTTNIHSRPPWLQGFFIQSGVQHESNGQSEEFSRSTNVLYLKPIFIFYNKESLLGLGLAPKVWLYFDNSKTGNPYLADYRGYFELEARVGLADGFVVGSKFKWAKEGGSVQLDLTYPLHRILSDNLSIYLHIQYVNSLAENLLNYQDRTEALRIGFSFIR